MNDKPEYLMTTSGAILRYHTCMRIELRRRKDETPSAELVPDPAAATRDAVSAMVEICKIDLRRSTDEMLDELEVKVARLHDETQLRVSCAQRAVAAHETIRTAPALEDLSILVFLPSLLQRIDAERVQRSIFIEGMQPSSPSTIDATVRRTAQVAASALRSIPAASVERPCSATSKELTDERIT